MATVGRAALVLALAVAVYGVLASLYGARTRRRDWVDSGRNAVYALARPDHAGVRPPRGRVPAQRLHVPPSWPTHSSTTTPTFYKASRRVVLPGGLAAAVAVAAVAVDRRRACSRPAGGCATSRPTRTAILLGLAAFFAGLLVFSASPFVALAVAPSEGAGLNPLLRHPSMMIHPPMLYSGYTLFAVPFAFAVGALIARRVDAEWIARRAASRSPPGSSWASGSCSARAGPTPSSAGAATGPGTRSRTPRCCRG